MSQKIGKPWKTSQSTHAMFFIWIKLLLSLNISCAWLKTHLQDDTVFIPRAMEHTAQIQQQRTKSGQKQQCEILFDKPWWDV